MRVLSPHIWLGVLLLLLLAACGTRYQANANWEGEINGICEACPTVRIDTLVRKLEGVMDLNYDARTEILRVQYDSNAIRPSSFITALNDAGYDVGDDASFFPTLIDACCIRSNQDLTSLLNAQDTVGLDPIAKQALLDSLRQMLANDVESLDELMDDVMGDAPSYDDVLRADLLGPSQNDYGLGGDDDILPEIQPEMSAREIEEDDADISRSLEDNSIDPPRPTPKAKPAPAKPKPKPRTKPTPETRNR